MCTRPGIGRADGRRHHRVRARRQPARGAGAAHVPGLLQVHILQGRGAVRRQDRAQRPRVSGFFLT